ncbi:MAG: hypothetical protein U1E51_06770 [Candidatus Binatia bacterium]|nr:hypothetical protein [Candidatus Binatia bacterium]
MKKIVMTLLALILLPTLVLAAELKGTVAKVDKAKNQLVIKTEQGEQTLEITKKSKGIEHAKQGAKVTVRFDDKDGSAKVVEIVAGG